MSPEHQQLLREYVKREYRVEIDDWSINKCLVVEITEDYLDPPQLWASLSDGTQVQLANIDMPDVPVYKPVVNWTDEQNLIKE